MSQPPATQVYDSSASSNTATSNNNNNNNNYNKNKRMRGSFSQKDIAWYRQKVQDDPYDISSWQWIVNTLKAQDDVEGLRSAFEDILSHYSSSAEIWSDYIDIELDHDNYDHAEKLFARCLPVVYKVSLWNKYLSYVKKVNEPKKKDTEDADTEEESTYQIIINAYEFALGRIGCDRSSGQIWMDYIQFMRSQPVSNPTEGQQKTDSVRATFTKALCIPLNNIENIWKGYNNFESTINQRNARKFIDDKASSYMHARSCNKELRNIITGINTSTLPEKRKWTAKERNQLEIWQKWIGWELKNPLNATPDVVQERVKYAYNQACMSLLFFPECWFEAVQYLIDIDSPVEEVIQVLKKGVHANPDSFLLTFKLAEIYERENNSEELHATYKAFIDHLKAVRKSLESRLGIQSEGEKAAASTEPPTPTSTPAPAPIPPVEDVLKTRDEKLLAFNAEDITYAYTEYMKNVKRLSGVKEARKIFGEARKLPYITYKVYEASAMMEYYSFKESGIASKIFEIGIKRYGEDARYVQKYFDFLILIDEEPNARALFEKSILKMTLEQQKIMFLHYIKFESEFGDMLGLKKLEDRFKELFPEDHPALTAFRARYTQSVPQNQKQKDAEVDPIEDVDFGRRFQSLPKDVRVRFAEPVEQSFEFDDYTDERAKEPQPAKKKKKSSNDSQEVSASDSGNGVVPSPRDTIPATIVSLLADLPPAEAYDIARFDCSKLITMLQVLDTEASRL